MHENKSLIKCPEENYIYKCDFSNIKLNVCEFMRRVKIKINIIDILLLLTYDKNNGIW